MYHVYYIPWIIRSIDRLFVAWTIVPFLDYSYQRLMIRTMLRD